MLLMLRLMLAAAAAGALLVDASGVISDARKPDEKVDEKLDNGERAKVIKSFESNLLSMLGLPKRPRPPRNETHVPAALEELFRQQGATGGVNIVKRGVNAGNANTVRSFVHVESKIDEMFESPHTFRLLFNVSSVPAKEKLSAAELILNRESLKPYVEGGKKVSSSVTLMVHDIVRPGIKGKSKPQMRLIDTKVLDIKSNSTVSLDVHPAVERWLSKVSGHSGNYGLLIKLTGEVTKPKGQYRRVAHLRLRRSPDEKLESWQKIQPTLYTYTDDGSKTMSTASDIMDRRTRDADLPKYEPGNLPKHHHRDSLDNCRIHPFYINFADLGWDEWILAPAGYDMHYCDGDCLFPLTDQVNATKHAMVQNIIHSRSPRDVARICCVPTVLTSMSILYYDQNNEVVLKNYHDMSVKECGCR